MSLTVIYPALQVCFWMKWYDAKLLSGCWSWECTVATLLSEYCVCFPPLENCSQWRWTHLLPKKARRSYLLQGLKIHRCVEPKKRAIETTIFSFALQACSFSSPWVNPCHHLHKVLFLIVYHLISSFILRLFISLFFILTAAL